MFIQNKLWSYRGEEIDCVRVSRTVFPKSLPQARLQLQEERPGEEEDHPLDATVARKC